MGLRFAMALSAAAMSLTIAAWLPIPAANALSSEIIMTDHGFSPSSLQATEGDPVTIIVRNRSKAPHNLVIPDFYIFTYNLKPGESTRVGFTPDKTGEYPFYSDTGGHPEPGFEGSLTIRAGR